MVKEIASRSLFAPRVLYTGNFFVLLVLLTFDINSAKIMKHLVNTRDCWVLYPYNHLTLYAIHLISQMTEQGLIDVKLDFLFGKSSKSCYKPLSYVPPTPSHQTVLYSLPFAYINWFSVTYTSSH